MPDAHAFMARALRLARRGLYTAHPNPRVGCVLVRDGEIVGEGWHEYHQLDHAETVALIQAGDRTRGADAYVTLEPCCHQGRTPPCTDALLTAGVRRVIAAMEDPDPRVAGRGLAQLRETGVVVECGLLADQAQALNRGFVTRATRGRPWFRVKLAMSLDGRTAMASGESRWITDEAARQDVQRLRAESAAILTGVATILADDPALTARLPGLHHQPLRVILDPALDTPPRARTLAMPGPVLILTAVEDPARRTALVAAGAEVATVPASANGLLDLEAIARELGRREINEVHTECGPTLAGALLQTGLVDELVVYLAPVLLGDAAQGLFRLPGLARMRERFEFEISDLRAVGRDWRLTARPKT
ncbi:MAG: bifunctional diaminohydroxyphosphoribosylaminopyrimidine deaminase/5-amino-6-(5-phosphoribosylamino)uracil reductase RibD [Candidatus Competibacterales bacterium]|nr:bifunctional diaminohydroxyphosphoribosylaminopyrimidine deaminase/5-amino-6-(5-phosphoribosylamino)uracil reductase RibD [Candidatus Competibacterales bacterium]